MARRSFRLTDLRTARRFLLIEAGVGHTLFAELSSIFLAVNDVLNEALDATGRDTFSYVRDGGVVSSQ